MSDEPAVSVVFRDILANTLLAFMALLLIVISHVNPKAKAATQPPGALFVTATWPSGLSADVDLWVEAPGDGPVGYSRQNSTVFNLLRDDLGKEQDQSDNNFEMAVARSVPAGDYTVNLHLYSDKAAERPVPVTVEITLMGPHGPTRLWTGETQLVRLDEEKTVARFALDRQGLMQADSFSTMPKRLRTRAGR